MRSPKESSGQATVELVLTLPILVLLLGVIVEFGGVALDQVRLWHAAREAVRIAAVDRDAQRAEDAARSVGLEDVEVHVSPGPAERRRGDPTVVSLEYHPQGRLPILGELFEGIRIRARASMRIENP